MCFADSSGIMGNCCSAPGGKKKSNKRKKHPKADVSVPSSSEVKIKKQRSAKSVKIMGTDSDVDSNKHTEQPFVVAESKEDIAAPAVSVEPEVMASPLKPPPPPGKLSALVGMSSPQPPNPLVSMPDSRSSKSKTKPTGSKRERPDHDVLSSHQLKSIHDWIENSDNGLGTLGPLLQPTSVLQQCQRDLRWQAYLVKRNSARNAAEMRKSSTTESIASGDVKDSSDRKGSRKRSDHTTAGLGTMDFVDASGTASVSGSTGPCMSVETASDDDGVSSRVILCGSDAGHE